VFFFSFVEFEILRYSRGHFIFDEIPDFLIETVGLRLNPGFL